ncbi:MAG: hypothetical protein FJ267_07455, partial [Planctomycetes bacterium]|nr:hypothetical protein [Planctomycetota bacterium]
MTILSRRFKKVFQTPYYLCPIASLVCGLYLSSFSVGAERSAPVIQAIERFYARPVLNADDEPIAVDRITAGRLLIGELNCLSCHPASDSFRMSIDTKQAPILDDVGSRVRREWLREYLTKPHASKPGTTMPDVIAAIPEKDRVSTVDALAHFLIQSGTPIESHPNLSSAKRGDELFHKIGCVACHEPLNGIEPKPLASISLQNVDKKYTVSSLIGFLKNPLAVRPSGRMPTFSLKDEEYRDIAQRLVRSVDLTPNVHFSVHEATTDTFPDFEKQQPIAKGQCAGFDLEVAKRTSDFAIRFSTWLTVKQPGEFQITLGSDDWSRLFVNNKTVVDNGGTHPHQTKTGSVSLEAGSHPVIVDFFQRGGEWTLEVDVSGPGFKQQPLANFCTLESEGRSSDRPNTTSSPRESSSDPLLIEQGRKLFASLGCAACHSLKQGDQRIESTLKSKPLDELNVENGCLSSTNPGIAPRFGLSVIQLELIRSALNAKDHAEPASETIHRQMAWLNCYACHRRGYFGGVEKDRDPFFTTHQKEMGDEGRIPPSLNGVGDKLRPEFLKEVLHQGGSDRKHSMVTRMPKFGPDNVGRLMELFQAVDTKSDPLPERKIPEPEYRIK